MQVRSIKCDPAELDVPHLIEHFLMIPETVVQIQSSAIYIEHSFKARKVKIMKKGTGWSI